MDSWDTIKTIAESITGDAKQLEGGLSNFAIVKFLHHNYPSGWMHPNNKHAFRLFLLQLGEWVMK